MLLFKFVDRCRAWVVYFLRQGLSPEKLAWCVSLSAGLGVFPVLGSTTLLCLMGGTLSRLNQPAMQSINYLVYPVQFVLLIPFYKAGAWLFNEPPVTVTLVEVRRLIGSGVWPAIVTLWTTTWHAIVAWCFIIPLGVIPLYAVLRWIFVKVEREVARPR